MLDPLIRIALCLLGSMLFTIICISYLLPCFSSFIIQTVRTDVIQHHKFKEGTPTMGGVFIAITLVGSMFFIEQTSKVITALFAFFSYSLIGFIDDFYKIKRGNGNGLTGRQKVLLMIISASCILYRLTFEGSWHYWQIPFSGLEFDLAWYSVLPIYFVIIGTSNAVNLTDGLDGLLLMPYALALLGLVALSMMTNMNDALLPLMAVILGSCFGVLLFNINPAKLFLGDTGSLGLGGFLATISLLMHKALFLVPLGLLFVVEALSVIIQVISFKFRGKRIFKMSPLHHHFELHGFSENTIVAFAWVISLIVVIITVLLEASRWV